MDGDKQHTFAPAHLLATSRVSATSTRTASTSTTGTATATATTTLASGRPGTPVSLQERSPFWEGVSFSGLSWTLSSHLAFCLFHRHSVLIECTSYYPRPSYPYRAEGIRGAS